MKFPIFRREAERQAKESKAPAADYRKQISYAGTPPTALKIAAVYRAVNLISNAIGVLPMHYKRYNAALKYFKTDYDTVVGSRLNYLLSVKPNDRLTAFQFWKQVVCQVLLYGNAYIYPRLNIYGEPVEFILCTAGSVAYNALANTYYVNDMYNGISQECRADEILHIRNMNLNGYEGVSTITYAANVLGIAATGDDETLRRFATGGRFKAILSNITNVMGFGKYQDKQLDGKAKEMSDALGVQDIIGMSGDVKVTPFSMSSTDMQFLDSRKFTVREIARFFNIPAAKLMDDSNTVYGSAEAANLAFYSEALQPIIEDIEDEFRSKLLGESRYQNYKFCFDISSLFVMDRKSQAEWNKSRIETGLVSVNELRREMDAPPVADGDDVFLSVNLAPLGSDKLSGKTSNPNT